MVPFDNWEEISEKWGSYPPDIFTSNIATLVNFLHVSMEKKSRSWKKPLYTFLTREEIFPFGQYTASEFLWMWWKKHTIPPWAPAKRALLNGELFVDFVIDVQFFFKQIVDKYGGGFNPLLNTPMMRKKKEKFQKHFLHIYRRKKVNINYLFNSFFF